jgi:hypothetical protein
MQNRSRNQPPIYSPNYQFLKTQECSLLRFISFAENQFLTEKLSSQHFTYRKASHLVTESSTNTGNQVES